MFSTINLHDIKSVKISSKTVDYAGEKIEVIIFSFIEKDGNKTEVSAYSEYNDKINISLVNQNDK